MTINFHLLRGNGVDNVVAINPLLSNPIKQADSTHPHFDEIVKRLFANDDSVWDLFDVRDGISKQFEKITDKVSWNGNDILWDGKPVHSALAQHLLDAISQGDVEAYTAIAKFWEKMDENPDLYSRTQLFDWLTNNDFSITTDGDIIMYKRVYRTDNGYESAHRGTASVNGTLFSNTRIPQRIGDVVTMPRREVMNDPNVACHKGLHAASYEYASNFSGNVLLEVHVNPKHVVSIPNDSSFTKVRCEEYLVVREVQVAYDRAVVLGDYQPQAYSDVSYKSV